MKRSRLMSTVHTLEVEQSKAFLKQQQEQCTSCNGSGNLLWLFTCDICGGSGKKKKRKKPRTKKYLLKNFEFKKNIWVLYKKQNFVVLKISLNNFNTKEDIIFSTYVAKKNSR